MTHTAHKYARYLLELQLCLCSVNNRAVNQVVAFATLGNFYFAVCSSTIGIPQLNVKTADTHRATMFRVGHNALQISGTCYTRSPLTG